MILRNLLVGLPIVLVCLLLQAWFTFWGIRYYVRRSEAAIARSGFGLGLGPVLIVMLAMMLGTVLQVVLWGLVFMALGEFDESYEAVYHSAVNYASLGYGDIVMGKDWKLLGPLEALCGVLMLGMTAGAMVVILQQLAKTLRDS